jgi:hypothetical protein
VGSEDRHPQAVGQLTQLAFGWGGRDVAKDLIERYYDRSDEVTTNNR